MIFILRPWLLPAKSSLYLALIHGNDRAAGSHVHGIQKKNVQGNGGFRMDKSQTVCASLPAVLRAFPINTLFTLRLASRVATGSVDC